MLIWMFARMGGRVWRGSQTLLTFIFIQRVPVWSTEFPLNLNIVLFGSALWSSVRMRSEVCIFRPDPKALWNQQESPYWLARFGAGSYFCGVKGHVSYRVEFRTAGPFVFWIAANSGKKFNFPLWSACDRLLQWGAHKPLFPLLGWASAVKNSVLSGSGSLSWEKKKAATRCKRVRGPRPGVQVRRPVSKGLFVWSLSCKSRGTSLISTRWWVN